jgi:hypothetical protein
VKDELQSVDCINGKLSRVRLKTVKACLSRPLNGRQREALPPTFISCSPFLNDFEAWCLRAFEVLTGDLRLVFVAKTP